MNNFDFKDLRVWTHSMAIAKDIYKIIRILPIEERFALADQIRRSTISVPSNIAEGQRRSTDRDFYHFLSIASGSLAELQTQLMLCVDLEYIPEVQMLPILNELEEIDKMLNGLIRSVAKRLKKKRNKRAAVSSDTAAYHFRATHYALRITRYTSYFLVKLTLASLLSSKLRTLPSFVTSTSSIF